MDINLFSMKDLIVKILLWLVAIWWLVMSGLCFWQGTYFIAVLFLIIGVGMTIYFIYDLMDKYMTIKKNKKTP